MKPTMAILAGLALGILCSSAAWGQSEQEVTSAVGPEMDVFAQCLKTNTYNLAKADRGLDEQAVVDKAISACESERKTLAKVSTLRLGWTSREADDQIAAMIESIRGKMIQTVHAARG